MQQFAKPVHCPSASALIWNECSFSPIWDMMFFEGEFMASDNGFDQRRAGGRLKFGIPLRASQQTMPGVFCQLIVHATHRIAL